MRKVVVVVAAGWLALNGCSRGAELPAATGLLAPTPQPSNAGQQVTVLGVARAGGLPGCDTLVTEDGMHYLLLDVPHPPLNTPVEVTGVLDTSLVSYCNSGQPLHVQRISRR